MKNKKSIIFNSIVIALCVLTFVFLIFPGFADEPGYILLGAGFQGFVQAIPIIFLALLVLLLLVSSIIALLGDCGAVKNVKLICFANKVSYLLAILIVFLYTVVICQLIAFAAHGTIFPWASIVNIIIDIAACVLVFVNYKIIRK